METKIKIIVGASLLAILIFIASYFLFLGLFETELKTLNKEDQEDTLDDPEDSEAENEEIDDDILKMTKIS